MNPKFDKHETFMSRCLKLAKRAETYGEVPIGALVVHNGEIIAQAYNKREKTFNATGHAELLAIQSACKKLGSWRLSSCDLYVSLEPCLMCAGALVQSRIRAVYFGAFDPKGGALGSLYEIHKDSRLNHRFSVHGGILEKECGHILREFFKKKRRKD